MKFSDFLDPEEPSRRWIVITLGDNGKAFLEWEVSHSSDWLIVVSVLRVEIVGRGATTDSVEGVLWSSGGDELSSIELLFDDEFIVDV